MLMAKMKEISTLMKGTIAGASLVSGEEEQCFILLLAHMTPGRFVACDMTGSYVTHDGGGSWAMFNLRKPVHFFVFDPLDTNTVYANGLGLFKSSIREEPGIFYTRNTSEITGIVSKGDHAGEILVTKDNSIREVLALDIDPENSKKLYTAIKINKSTAIYLSDDGGLHWKKEKNWKRDFKRFLLIRPLQRKQDNLCSRQQRHHPKIKRRLEKLQAPGNVTSLQNFQEGMMQGLENSSFMRFPEILL
jgi:hypothetical protein